MDELASRVVARLDEARPVALGFECPLFVPLAEDPEKLTSSRRGEGNRSWSAAAGAAALATGLVEVTWILRSIKQRLRSDVAVHLDWKEFGERQRGLFLWEAFMSGPSKASDHYSDAKAATRAFLHALPDVAGATAIATEGAVFLLGRGRSAAN